ncbi:Ig-like domain-containing protein, partial [Parabacteroides sp.]
ATMKSVSWSSSDETIATVDADGIVTGLKVGSCKITVATDDGNKTATCEVSVSTTVSIEQIFGDHQVYSVRGAITMNPARPISIRIIAVTGVDIYGGSITGTTRIPVSTGIYLVEIIENGKRMTTKVNVR